MDTGGGIWSILVIVGPIVLLIVLAWALLHNRSSQREKRYTEEATRRMYDKQGAEDRMREGD